MRILVVHNLYGSAAPSGENEVFRAEQHLLNEHGHQVETYVRESDEIRDRGLAGAVKGALAVPWNPWSIRALRDRVLRFRPDVVHVHNTFPLISPSIFHGLEGRCARVLTLHNYRLFCAAAIPLRDGRPCTDCLDRRSAWPGLRHGCYRGSRVATLPLAAGIALHRAAGTWTSQVEAFIALTPFQRETMVAAGLPAERVHVKPNFYPGRPVPVPWHERAPYAVFAGRLTAEKGVATLLEAWNRWGDAAPELRIVGDGPLRQQLQSVVRPGLRVRFLGQLPAADAQGHIAGARLLLLPSEWFEGFPMVLREAFAFGTPAAVSAIGPLPSLVESGQAGLIFESARSDSLLTVVRTAWDDPARLQALGQRARECFERLYTASANHEQLMAIYGAALGCRTAGPGC